ncbi:HAMP domain-containing methyl-accepting chemotaxis protein [Desulfococcaceae bacterium HSG8]|nr:HAMP domain-containing methyl-accepting chemotaxis protein [Desulfococcaceae bacterium HSG8]
MLNIFKNMKIATKIGLGFGILIVIILILGIFAIINTNRVRSESKILAEEYLPEVELAANIERYSLLAMYEMRGYALSNEKEYHERGLSYLEKIKKYLPGARELAVSHEHLVKLRQEIDTIDKEVKKYEKLVDKTDEKNVAIKKNQDILDTSAAIYMRNCYEYLESQNKKAEREIRSSETANLLNRLKKIDLVNDIIDLGNAARVANFKSQARRDPGFIQHILKNFDAIEKKLDEIRSVTTREIDLQRLEKIRESGNQYKNTMTDILDNWLELQELSKMQDSVAKGVLKSAEETSVIGMERIINVTSEASSLLSRVSKVTTASVIIAFITGVGVALLITVTITLPIKKIVTFTKQFGNGDLTAEIEIDARDEIGEMAGELKGAVIRFRNIMKKLAETTSSLSGSSEELSSLSSQMASSAEEMSSQSGMVASASEQVSTSVNMTASATMQSSHSLASIASMTEEMSLTFNDIASFGKRTSDNVTGMAASSEEISAQVSSVASASEEMTVSLNEVAKNTAQANRISQNANQQTDQVNARIMSLVSASKQIGKVVEVIKDIADQTNMLALNATIEAAGAGEAGKGFAVVAGEIKELAKQSADATEEIAGQIEEIQKSTSDVVMATGEISKVISELAGINEMIAASSEEQTATASEISKSVASTAVTVKGVSVNANESANLVEEIAKSTDMTSKTAAEIAKNIDELLNGVKAVARSSEEAAKKVNNISENIRGISVASRQTAMSASQTSDSSKELAKMASVLTQIVNKFRLS